MALNIKPFGIRIVHPSIVVLPGIYDDEVTITYVTATMQMIPACRGVSSTTSSWSIIA